MSLPLGQTRSLQKTQKKHCDFILHRSSDWQKESLQFPEQDFEHSSVSLAGPAAEYWSWTGSATMDWPQPTHAPLPTPPTHIPPPPCDVMSLNGSQWPVVTTTLVFGFHWHCKHTASGTHYTHTRETYICMSSTQRQWSQEHAVESFLLFPLLPPNPAEQVCHIASSEMMWAGLPHCLFRDDVSRSATLPVQRWCEQVCHITSSEMMWAGLSHCQFRDDVSRSATLPVQRWCEQVCHIASSEMMWAGLPHCQFRDDVSRSATLPVQRWCEQVAVVVIIIIITISVFSTCNLHCHYQYCTTTFRD